MKGGILMALIHCDFFSETLGISTSITVILPQNTKTQIGMTGSKERKISRFISSSWII